MTDDLRDELDFSEEELRNVADLTLLSCPTVPSGKTKSRRLEIESDAVNDQDVTCTSSCSEHFHDALL